MKTEEYKGIDMMPVPKIKEEALMKMSVEKRLYEELFKKNKVNEVMAIQVYYEYDRRKAIELGADVSQFPAELNYLETRN